MYHTQNLHITLYLIIVLTTTENKTTKITYIGLITVISSHLIILRDVLFVCLFVCLYTSKLKYINMCIY